MSPEYSADGVRRAFNSASAATGGAKLEDIFVLDADVHIHEQPAELAEYARSPWDVALREIATVPERYLDLPGMSPRAEYRTPWPGGSNRPQIVESAAALRRELDNLHVDVAVLFPDHLLFLAMVRDPRFAAALAQAYNAWLHERWLLVEPTLLGALVVAPQDPVSGAEDIAAHAGHSEFACIYLPASGVRPLYGHRSYDPIYEAAAAAGLPVVMHSVEAVYPTFPFQLEVFETSLAQHAIAHPFAMMANIVSMLETGVPVRHPDLAIGIMEAGTSWVPFLINRLDKEYTERRREVPVLQEPPSHYISNFYFGTQPIEEPERRGDIVALYELFNGAERAMFASDWPHHDFDHPRHVFGLPFSPEQKANIMGANAARFLRLPASAGA
jgi:predicted TIM-barrel fold metal-dependent hydrolase